MKTAQLLFCIAITVFLFIIIHPSSVYADVTPPVISSLSTSDVSSSSFKVTWTTDESSNSEVEYGTSQDYGSLITDNAMTTSHSVTVSGLSSNTKYYFYVKSSDSNGNRAESDNQTVTTSSSSSTTTTTTTKIVTATPLPSPTPDKVPPLINLSTDFSENYKEAPVIKGRASDVSGIASLEYSIDNGKNWLPIQEIASPLGGSTTFSFSPPTLFDGSYQIKIRSKDGLGNTGLSKTFLLTIDRLPPRVGSFLIKSGPFLLRPTNNNSLEILESSPYSLFASAVGGPNSINLYPHLLNQNKYAVKPIQLVKNEQTAIWESDVIFATSAIYSLDTTSIDGAENQTEKSLGQISVIPKGIISDGKNTLSDVEIKIYFQNPVSKNYQFWNGSSYDIANPVKSDSSGKYSLLLPSGSYYLTFKKQGFKEKRSQIINLSSSTFINSDIQLSPNFVLTIGSLKIYLPQFFKQEVILKSKSPPTQGMISNQLIGKPLPDFKLNFESETIDQFTFRAIPSLIVFLNTYSPQASDTLSLLSNLITKKKNFRIITVFPQETQESISVYKNRGKYTSPIFADPDGDLFELLKLSQVPAYVFLDRFGVITDIRQELLTEDEILTILTK